MLPSDAAVTGDALAFGLSSRQLGDGTSFSRSAQQTCRANAAYSIGRRCAQCFAMLADANNMHNDMDGLLLT